ncbi:MAG: ATPase domain-containing protein [Treponema sp.]
MNKKDLFDCSPIRAFDKITNGGIKAGEVGLITSKKGLGKTSVLVQFAMDSLLNDKNLVHVSFDQESSNVISWYSSVFAEIAKKKNISNAQELKDEIMRERVILNFNPENFTLQKLINTVSALKNAGTKVTALVIDGVAIKDISEADAKAVEDFAKSENISIWLTAEEESSDLKDCASPEVLAKIAAVLHIEAGAEGTTLNVLKLRNETPDASLKLDPKTQLISEK